MALSSQEARKRFEVENKITTEDPDQLYKYDVDRHQAFINQRAWTKEYSSLPHLPHLRCSVYLFLYLLWQSKLLQKS